MSQVERDVSSGPPPRFDIRVYISRIDDSALRERIGTRQEEIGHAFDFLRRDVMGLVKAGAAGAVAVLIVEGLRYFLSDDPAVKAEVLGGLPYRTAGGAFAGWVAGEVLRGHVKGYLNDRIDVFGKVG